MNLRRKRKLTAGTGNDDYELMLPPSERQWDDLAAIEKSALYDEENVPCSCELGGIGNAVLVSLGMVPIGGLLPQSLLIPLAATTQGDFSEKHRQRNTFWSWLRRKLKKSDYQPARIDYYARIWMPIFFILFSFIYWTVCLFMASKQYA
ncbi:unnamed protein product [Meloidogyne enterolobii]|uniref:Uncharacterized protein n=1 Tax=Meloidogyne enterolobii TaxID=390850 RepID=A0ACB0YE59_MELEN